MTNTHKLIQYSIDLGILKTHKITLLNEGLSLGVVDYVTDSKVVLVQLDKEMRDVMVKELDRRMLYFIEQILDLAHLIGLEDELYGVREDGH